MSKPIPDPADKPNVEYDDPAEIPSIARRASGRVSTAIFGRQGPLGFWLFTAAVALFLIAGGTIFYFLQ